MKKMSWSDGQAMSCVFVATLLLNLSIRSLFYNFDGVACAIAVELSDSGEIFHGTHPCTPCASGILAARGGRFTVA